MVLSHLKIGSKFKIMLVMIVLVTFSWTNPISCHKDNHNKTKAYGIFQNKVSLPIINRWITITSHIRVTASISWTVLLTLPTNLKHFDSFLHFLPTNNQNLDSFPPPQPLSLPTNLQSVIKPVTFKLHKLVKTNQKARPSVIYRYSRYRFDSPKDLDTSPIPIQSTTR